MTSLLTVSDRSSRKDWFKDWLMRLAYRWSPQQFVVETLQKRWAEPVFPFTLMLIVLGVSGAVTANYFTWLNFTGTAREFAEFGLVAIAMAHVVISGGIDLSVGAIFALADIAALYLFDVAQWPIVAVIPIVIAMGAAFGAFNGMFIGYVKTRPFMTTLVTLIVLRAVQQILVLGYAMEISASSRESEVWDFLGQGEVYGFPCNFIVFVTVALITHVGLSRSRPGWYLTAIGGSRRAARHAGIPVQRMIFLSYVLSGALCAVAGISYATRLGSASSDLGIGMELMAITAVVLGGVSLGGGRGSIGRALIGAMIVLILVNTMVRHGLPGGYSSMVIGAILLFAVGVDVKWQKHRAKVISKMYAVPTYVRLPKAPDTRPGSNTAFEENGLLSEAEEIGVGEVDGPEDVILDRQGRLYCSVRQGWILRFQPGATSKPEVFAVIGGRPLGMAFDRDENLIVAVGGMGVYGVRPDGEVYKITDETSRTPWKLKDNSRLNIADDVDIAPDGNIYFSECTVRYEIEEWFYDAIEGRNNGRMICYNSTTGRTRTIIRDISFPNGVVLSHDGQSILYAQTWVGTIMRYWIAGPNKGRLDTLISNLPGYPDNLNRASDGTYWAAFVGIRTPIFDLAMREPGFRKRMVKRLPPDEWLFPNINNGCIVKFDDQGKVLGSYWDVGGRKHATITSMREHRGYLYIGGLNNNRIGRIKLRNADPNWIGSQSYWGKAESEAVLSRVSVTGARAAPGGEATLASEIRPTLDSEGKHA